MPITKLAIWVHPLWSCKDLGQPLADSWRQSIEKLAKDQDRAFILTGCPTNECQSEQWGNRIYPIIDSLPTLFPQKFIRWPTNYVSPTQEDVNQLQTHIDFPKVEFESEFPVRRVLQDARIDGLIPGPHYCVGEQVRRMWPLCGIDNVYYWS